LKLTRRIPAAVSLFKDLTGAYAKYGEEEDYPDRIERSGWD